MEIYQLRAFLAVARVGHLTRAAEQLHLTQPAVSKQIKALEQELGVLLFDRQPTGMALSREGRAILSQAERTLFDATELVNMARQLRGDVAGVVTVGTIIDPDTLRLGSFLGALLAYYPKVQARLQHGISGGILERVRKGELDVGFYLGPVAEADISAMPMRSVRYLVIGPSAWADRLAQATVADLALLPWIGTPVHSSQHRLVKNLFAAVNMTVRIVAEADQEATMTNLVSSGVGLATMREDLARAAAARGEVTLWHGSLPDCPLSFVFRTDRSDEALVSACIKAVAEVWPQGA